MKEEIKIQISPTVCIVYENNKTTEITGIGAIPKLARWLSKTGKGKKVVNIDCLTPELQKIATNA